MSTYLATSNPEAVATEIDPGHDRRKPYVGQVVLFHPRIGMGQIAPAVVLQVNDDDHVDLCVILGASGPATVSLNMAGVVAHRAANMLSGVIYHSVPRGNEQNTNDVWAFNDHDRKHYHKDAVKHDPHPTGRLDWDDVRVMHDTIIELRNRLAEVEAGRFPHRGVHHAD